MYASFVHERRMLKVRLIKRLLLIILTGIFIYSGAHIVMYLYDGYKSNTLHARLKQQYTIGLQAEHAAVPIGNETESKAQAMQQRGADKFKSLLEINSDTVGWISIAGTKIDYPVVKYSDNDYYLNHDIERKRSLRGAIFMDYRNEDITKDAHTVIYGHHMKDGSMFGELSNYKNEAYYNERDIIEFDGLEQSTTWKIFSVYTYTPQHQFFQFEFNNEQEYSEYLQKIIAESSYDTGVNVSTQDQILTLVTCTYEVSDARFIVHAKRID